MYIEHNSQEIASLTYICAPLCLIAVFNEPFFFYRNVEVHGGRGAGGKSNFVALEDLSNHSTAPNREQNRTSAW